MHRFNRLAYQASLLALILATAMLFAACSDDDDDGDDAIVPTTAADDSGDGNGDDGNDDNGDDGGEADSPSGDGPGEERAIVTIGDETFEFELSTVCLTMGGAIAGSGRNADGDVDVSIDIPPEDWETSSDDGWEPPSIRVDDDRDPQDERSWRAGGEVVAGMQGIEGRSQVDSFSTDGSRSTGTATFTDINQFMVDPDATEPVTGTFDIQC